MSIRITIPSPFDEFMDGFHSDFNYFADYFYNENQELIHSLFFDKFDNELNARFPVRLDTTYIDMDGSVYQRCLYRFSNFTIQKIKSHLYNMIFSRKFYDGNLVFMFFRYLDTFAFMSKIPTIYLNNEYFREMIDFNNVSRHFFKTFKVQKKIRDLMPSYRLENKLDLRKDNMPYCVVLKSFSELEKLIFHVDKRIKADKYFLDVILPEYKKFKSNMENIYNFIMFTFQKVAQMSAQQKISYYKFMLDNSFL